MNDSKATIKIITALELLHQKYERTIRGFEAQNFTTAAQTIREEADYVKTLISQLHSDFLTVSPSTLKNK